METGCNVICKMGNVKVKNGTFGRMPVNKRNQMVRICNPDPGVVELYSTHLKHYISNPNIFYFCCKIKSNSVGSRYTINKDSNAFFLTMTVIDWIDVFTRKNHKIAIVESLIYCQQNKGLNIFGWCLMTNHLHLIVSANENINLSDIIRDFKKFTSKKIVSQIQEEPESRRDWMLDKFEFAGRFNSKIKEYKFWQDGNHAEEILTGEFAQQKLDYIHNNPVRAMIVAEPHEYLFSSARNYADMKGLIEVTLI
jgi:putative transposase